MVLRLRMFGFEGTIISQPRSLVHVGSIPTNAI
ncbi:hypothetical protein OA78_0632 [Latilactobacillus curvatus]|nr:hypothetical protein OA78_0632 [Latilactobacillus curvatus]